MDATTHVDPPTDPHAGTHAPDPGEVHFTNPMHKHHVCDPKTFMGILAALLVLTFVTVAVSWFDFGGANMWIAMAVSSIKASLVISVFMHMIWDTTINRIFFLSSFLFLGLLFLFAFADLFARGDMEKKHERVAPLDSLNTGWYPVRTSGYRMLSNKKKHAESKQKQ